MIDDNFQNYINGCSILSGTVRHKNLCYLVALGDESVKSNLEHAICMEFENGNMIGLADHAVRHGFTLNQYNILCHAGNDAGKRAAWVLTYQAIG